MAPIRDCIASVFFLHVSHCFSVAQINALSDFSICSSWKKQAVHSADTAGSRWPSGLQQTRSLRPAVCRERRKFGMCNQHPRFIKCLSVVIGDVAWPGGSNPLQSILITLFHCQKFGYHSYNEMLTVGDFKCS